VRASKKKSPDQRRSGLFKLVEENFRRGLGYRTQTPTPDRFGPCSEFVWTYCKCATPVNAKTCSGLVRFAPLAAFIRWPIVRGISPQLAEEGSDDQDRGPTENYQYLRITHAALCCLPKGPRVTGSSPRLR
jgi:hypothetical protein